MNIQHLKYALEVAKASSLSKAAENLFIGQPNLSRAIKELENSLGITIFERSAKGVTVTPEGEEFLVYAKEILNHIDDVEFRFKNRSSKKQTLSISVPRSTYISHAFANFADKMDRKNPVEITYKETNAYRAINNILNSNYKLGIIRYADIYDKNFKDMLEDKGLDCEVIAEFTCVLVMHKSHPLAQKEEISFVDLAPYTQIAHSDTYVPSIPYSDMQKVELPDEVNKRIFVFERASQLDLLTLSKGTFMWVSPFPKAVLDRYDLVHRICHENEKIYKDVLIYRKGDRFSSFETSFIEEVKKTIKKEFEGLSINTFK